MPKNVVISEDGTVSAAPPNRVAPSRSPRRTASRLAAAKQMAKVILPFPSSRTDQRRTGYRHRHRQRQQRQPANHSASADITAPDKPIITQVLDDVESFTGPLVNGQTTNDNRPPLAVRRRPARVVEVFDNGVSLGLATLQPNGAWTFTPSQI
ncbi:large repetitive protein [Salmonella enterica subsp. enterica]|nr:large repetitive protein [Salmonella enterica subsp. enterica]